VTRARKTVLTLFGTRPEVIKLAPVIGALEASPETFRTINVTSAQHTDLLYPFVRLFGIRVDHDLQVMAPHQPLNEVCARVLSRLDAILAETRPDVLLVQGDTTTAMAGALAAFHRRIRVDHVEAGLRSGDARSPYPEEMNRRLVSRLATWHFAATAANRDTLVAEGVPLDRIFVTGNPVVDSLQMILRSASMPPRVAQLLDATEGFRRVVLTTHRRESFGEVMRNNLKVLRRFVMRRPDVALLFPVHPNPDVLGPATEILAGHPRIKLVPPLAYDEFVVLLSRAWLIVSDSGGVQEEAPTLGKPLLVLRENTERPEAVDAGVARLVGDRPGRLALMLDEVYRDESWVDKVGGVDNPFGRGDAGARIGEVLARVLR
jgi:UDP-N-acetylglucosamine 2-epimerase (non-hydrolysing)